MSQIIEMIYEQGVFKPLTRLTLKEQQRYRLLLLETTSLSPAPNETIAVALDRRLTTLPDGQCLLDLLGLFQFRNTPALNAEQIDAVLDEVWAIQANEWIPER